MTVKQFKDVLKHQANAELTLINEQGEKYYAGAATEVRSHRRSLTLKWPLDTDFNNIYPFTYALLHSGSKILSGVAIKPLDPDEMGSSIELTYDYE